MLMVFNNFAIASNVKNYEIRHICIKSLKLQYFSLNNTNTILFFVNIRESRNF